ncbi:hypothetical protein ACHAQH_009935 [Verticillium albo-atrum]
MPQASPNPKSYEDYTIAVVCAMSFEMSAFRYKLDNEHPRLRAKPGDPNAYKLGDFHGQQGKGTAAAVNISRTFPSNAPSSASPGPTMRLA